MNKKGFSLIELVIVITLLAVLMLMLVPNIITIINKNDVKSCHNLEDSIISAAKTYVKNNKYNLDFKCNETKQITLQALIDAGDLELSNNKLTNPVTNSNIPYNKVVDVIYNCTTKEFSYNFNLNCE